MKKDTWDKNYEEDREEAKEEEEEEEEDKGSGDKSLTLS